MSYYGFRPYVPVAQRRQQAARELEKLKKRGQPVSPVIIEGKRIARSFWGKAWCDNLESYSDFENRLPRGRTYVRNGSVLDLLIARGHVRAMVSGSDIYKIKIEIATVSPTRWKAICSDCLGSIGSLVELLQGKLSKSVMERVCRPGDGLFPSPSEIKMQCSCPDWAGMCKHVAAALYGAGARLDEAPDLLFTLRGVDRSELIASAGTDFPSTAMPVASDRILADDDVAALFGIDMDPEPSAPSRKKAVAKASPAKSSRAAGAPSFVTPLAGTIPTCETKSSNGKPKIKQAAKAPSGTPTADKQPKRYVAVKNGAVTERTAARSSSAQIRTPDKTVLAITVAPKKKGAAPAPPASEPGSPRRTRTKAARWIKNRTRK